VLAYIKVVNNGQDREFVDPRPGVNFVKLFFYQVKWEGGSCSCRRMFIMGYNILNYCSTQETGREEPLDW
jgi:hypothetical protein